MLIKVEYDTKGEGINEEVDAKIREAMNSIDAKWYAQGTDIITGMRDLAFDYEEVK